MFELRTMLLCCIPLLHNSREHMICLEVEVNDFQMMPIGELLRRRASVPLQQFVRNPWQKQCPAFSTYKPTSCRAPVVRRPSRTCADSIAGKPTMKDASCSTAVTRPLPASCYHSPLSPIYLIAQASALPCQSLKAKKRISKRYAFMRLGSQANGERGRKSRDSEESEAEDSQADSLFSFSSQPSCQNQEKTNARRGFCCGSTVRHWGSSETTGWGMIRSALLHDSC